MTNGRSIQRHVQAHRLQPLSVEVEHEGRVGGQGSMAVGAVRRWKTRQDRCTDLGGDAHERSRSMNARRLKLS